MTALSTKAFASEKLLQTFSSMGLEDFSDEALQIIKKRKLLDFYILPSMITAKIQDENGKMHFVEIRLKDVSNDDWQWLINRVSKKAIYLASLLNGELNADLCNILEETKILPMSINEYRISYDYKETTELNLHITAALLKLSEKIQEDPFSIFLLRGKGRDEILLDIKRQRELMIQTKESLQKKPVNIEGKEIKISQSQLENYWKHSSSLLKLSYSLRADDLPAAILKRLDSLPLNGFEEQADRILEDAYNYITTRAQAYALGLK